MTQIIRSTDSTIERTNFEATVESARTYYDNSQSASTLRAYKSDWSIFCQFCEDMNLESLPATPATVAIFLAAQADEGFKMKTIERRINAIVDYHNRADQVPPTKQVKATVITKVLKGIRRDHRDKPVDKKQAATRDVIKKMLDAIQGNSLKDLRDRAVISFGMVSAMRRSEISNMKLKDLDFDARDGFVKVTIPFSKSDQFGAGQVCSVPAGSELRPIEHLKAWLEAANITDPEDYVFAGILKDGKQLRKPRLSKEELELQKAGKYIDIRNHAPLTGNAINDIVKNRAYEAGFDPTNFGAHSLRSGFVTTAANEEVAMLKIAKHTRHKNVEMLMEYFVDEQLFEDHAAAKWA